MDDTSLLQPRATAPAADVVVTRYLEARDGRHGGIVGQLVCPVSRLAAVVAALAKASPDRPVDLSLVVDTGLGAVPKALSTVFSRQTLLTARTVETAAPPDVDAMWLERVSEFVPEDVVAVVEPRRPHANETDGTAVWLDAVRRVADHGCAPKLRCGGSRVSDVPPVSDVASFVAVAVNAERGFTTLGMREAIRSESGHGFINLIVAVSRVLNDGDVPAALESTDGPALAAELEALSEQQVTGVRKMLARCGAELDAEPAEQLTKLGLLA
ncbi:hypothetical protein [Pseudonocardia sp. TRM90224]|uniref:hypothetical protein n=1 Tax=Pseudonocardia sp. TRM90224 TaxID=2812678 RepID=UPI001E3F7985|nr:hypothetical protein [Pseudonocardia sp. TRM90224]